MSSSSESLVISFDIGTTSSAVAIAQVNPNQTPTVRTVNSWPHSPNDLKVPSHVYFNKNGEAIAFGAQSPEFTASLNEHGYELAKWWKLHLHPNSMHFDTVAKGLEALTLTNSTRQTVPDFQLTPLPFGVDIEYVYSSFIKYLYENTKIWFINNTVGGEARLNRLFNTSKIVFAIPDGWDENQQLKIRRAFLKAGVLSTSDSSSRLSFIREAEAVVHFALKSPTKTLEWLKPGVNFTVADLGGSTTDVCLYNCVSLEPLEIKELKISDSVQVGGVFVDKEAENLLKKKVAQSTFNTPSIISTLVDIFEEKTKRKFDGGQSLSILKFGGNQDNDKSVEIKAGRLTLTDKEVRSTFDFCLNEIIASIQEQIQLGDKVSTHIIVSGGFGESPYLRKILRETFPSYTLETSDEPSKKAVAVGACVWFTSQIVTARAVRFSLGIACSIPATLCEDEAYSQMSRSTRLDGITYVNGCWSSICRKGEVMGSNSSWEQPYHRSTESKCSFNSIDTTVLVSLDGSNTEPLVCETPYGSLLDSFETKCRVTANLGVLVNSLKPLRKGTYNHPATKYDISVNNIYWRVEYSVHIFVAGASLSAKIKWIENGEEKESPAQVIIDEKVDRGPKRQIAITRESKGW